MFESAAGNLVTIVVFAGLLMLAAASDVISYKIPNKVVLAILAVYPLHVLVSPAPVDWLMGLATFAISLAIGFALFATGKFGAGDAKLLAAVLLWAGPEFAPFVAIVCAILGGILALIMLSPLRFVLAGMLASAGRQAASEAVLSKDLPYGVPIAFSGLLLCWMLYRLSALSG